MPDSTDTYKEGRELLLTAKCGILSTHSIDVPGYPFGSVTPYCLDYDGRPVILISSIAQHTKNICSNPKISLTITEEVISDPQSHARLTYLADAEKINDRVHEVSERYYRYFPQSSDYHRTHDFSFYRLNLVRARFIGGFSKIYWLERGHILLKNPFTADEEKGIISHMNKDHKNALKYYGERFKNLDWQREEEIFMAGIDGEGFDLSVSNRFFRFSFPKRISNLKEARTVLTEMAKR